MAESLVKRVKGSGRRAADRWMLSRFIRRHNLSVLAGPFRDMRYVGRSRGSALLPKLLGTYECELHRAIAAAVARGHQTVIDVGCAEGYYAVGLARLLPAARVKAFDIDPEARTLCRQLADINGVGNRVEVLGECSPDRLSEILGADSLVFCDCEGYEEVLLDPGKTPGLVNAHIIVELHDFISAGITERVLSRFEATHRLEVFLSEERDLTAYPYLEEFPSWYRKHAVSERRPPGMKWCVMHPMSSAYTIIRDEATAVQPGARS